MSPWLGACRQSVADIKGVLADLPTREEREPVARLGEGGDDTTAIDAAAEAAVVARLAGLDESFTLISEELGEASEAFLASSLREVHPVHAIDGVALAQAPGPASTAAAAAVREHIEAQLARVPAA